MGETQHTPGPWQAFDRTPGDPPTIGPYGRPSVCYLAANFPRPEEVANARLIASAPDLLAACQQLVSLSESGLFKGSFEHPSLEDSDAVAAARAAIARAEKGTP